MQRLEKVKTQEPEELNYLNSSKRRMDLNRGWMEWPGKLEQEQAQFCAQKPSKALASE